MAENDPKPADVDALAAMAGGADLNEPDPYVEQQAEIEPADETPPAGDLAQFAPRPDSPDSPNSPSPRPPSTPRIDAPPPLSRAEAAKRLAAITSAAYTSQLKKMLTPLLLGIGVILVVIALLCLFGSGDAVPGEQSKYLFTSDFKLFSLICGPLGLILLVGAYWFYLESKRKKK